MIHYTKKISRMLGKARRERIQLAVEILRWAVYRTHSLTVDVRCNKGILIVGYKDERQVFSLRGKLDTVADEFEKLVLSLVDHPF